MRLELLKGLPTMFKHASSVDVSYLPVTVGKWDLSLVCPVKWCCLASYKIA